jgi:uncharacterized protein YgiB involved in biofilm formation
MVFSASVICPKAGGDDCGYGVAGRDAETLSGGMVGIDVEVEVVLIGGYGRQAVGEGHFQVEVDRSSRGRSG